MYIYAHNCLHLVFLITGFALSILMLNYWVYKCSVHLRFHNCSYEYKITLFILLDAAYWLQLCFVWCSYSRLFFCLHLPGIALPSPESFYFRWISCINLIWGPSSSNKGMLNAYIYCRNYFGSPRSSCFVFSAFPFFSSFWATADDFFYLLQWFGRETSCFSLHWSAFSCLQWMF